MAKERTEQSCYQSRFGGGWLTASQYLAENMCSRKGRSEGSELAPFFWREPYWQKEFLKQKRFAEDLLKDFDIQSIIAALKHPDAKKIYSFGAKSTLIPLIQKHQRKLDIREEINSEGYNPEPVDVYQKPRKPFGRSPSLIQRLRELKDGEEEK
jgi:hypothetical protein